MKRDIYNELCQWKSSLNRKPLILMGARQVGKTTILKKFAENEYSSSIYLNFEKNSKLCSLFSENLNPERILKALEIEMDSDLIPEKSLLILDEIQECPEALNSLKYFCEQLPQYHICAAGSLLGVQLSKQKGFPVGKVDFKYLYPMTYIEFLNALGQTKLVQYLFSEINNYNPLPNLIHEKLLNYFKSYLLIGGMPEAISRYIQSEDYKQVREIQKNIITSYNLDFIKHAPQDIIMKINQIWQSIPSQLSKENNRKFVYSLIRQGARAKEFEAAIQWLVEAGLVYKTYNVSIPKLPLKAYMDFKSFKLFLNDVGLLAAMTDIPIKAILHGDILFTEFKGVLIENYAAQALIQQEYGLYYWTSNNRAEIDFLLQYDNQILPLEIKSGLSSRKKSLLSYKNRYNPKLSIRSSIKNLKLDNDILNIPLYLLCNISKLLLL